MYNDLQKYVNQINIINTFLIIALAVYKVKLFFEYFLFVTIFLSSTTFLVVEVRHGMIPRILWIILHDVKQTGNANKRQETAKSPITPLLFIGISIYNRSNALLSQQYYITRRG